ncbi:type II toxin-antitoxin system PemK/MazF family toxin [Paenibacillus sp. WLX1005]|uniref:type II toxin-antitoxin system PemK/MazF family toxin n=1 Tax=Paenibacillus sp. WLX1005 TaxID=3243766 RepID=UPI003983F4C6
MPLEGANNFQRGWVIKAHFPETKESIDTPKPSFIMKGLHFAIVLHDHDFEDVDSRSVLVVPITTAKAEANRAQKENRSVMGSLVRITQEKHPFLDHDSYVSTGQVVTLNREWLDSYKGEMDPDTMLQVDLQLIQTLNLYEAVETLIALKALEQQQELQDGSSDT